MRLIRVLSALGVFICFVLWVSSALASRNSSGTMAGINGPYVAGTTISSSVINARFSDIETEITDSLNRSGKGGMLAALRGTDGTVTAPAFSFTSETGTGLYRIGSSDLGVAINQSKKLELTSSLFTVVPNVSLTGYFSSNVGIGGAPSFLLDVVNSGATTSARLGSNFQVSLIGSTANGSGFAGNLQNDGSWKYINTSYGALVALSSANGNVEFYSAPSGTAGNAATLTFRASVGPSGLTIGASGTAISKSVSGTASFATGNMNANTCVAVTVTTTGSTSGSPCAVGNSADPGDGRFVISCRTHTADQCSVDVCNVGAITLDPADFTVRCTVFNP